jgi:multisubunit Na+/H+ antiporter MnhB subunit
VVERVVAAVIIVLTVVAIGMRIPWRGDPPLGSSRPVVRFAGWLVVGLIAAWWVLAMLAGPT